MRWVLGLLILGLLAACSADPAPSGSTPASITASPSGPAPASPSGTPAPELTTRPLVLAVNARRPPLDVSRGLAERIRRGEVTNWRALGEPAAPLRVTERSPVRGLAPGTVAVVVADAVGPGVRVVRVDGVDPLRNPTDYPLQVTGPAPGRVTTMTIVGDVMLGRSVTGRPALDPMAARLSRADVTVGNLESTLATLGPPNPVQGDHFHAPPSVVDDLDAAGFDVLSLANNHTGDYGDDSLLASVSLLRGAGFATVGAGRDLAAARRPAVVRRHGTSFGFVGFNAIGETPEAGPGRPGALSVSMPPRTGPLDTAELDGVLDDVRRLAARVDVVTVLPHWGEQYTYEPWAVQRRVARALARAGADLVVGGHPHWVQGADLVGDTFVVHSLGNFVFDMDTPETDEGLVLEATFWDDRLVAAQLVPYRIGPDHAPRVVPVSEAQRMLDGFWEFSSLGATP